VAPSKVTLISVGIYGRGYVRVCCSFRDGDGSVWLEVLKLMRS
jgi:hypothetical protein